MKYFKKIIYILTVVVLCVLFFWFGWSLHKDTPPPETTIKYEPSNGLNFTQNNPFLSVAYEICPFIDTPDTQTCVTKLYHSTIDKANVLAEKLAKTSPQNSSEQMVGYFDELHNNLKLLKNDKDNYVSAFCSLDMTRFYGGTVMGSEVMACHYFYAKQYLELLKILYKDTEK